MLFALIIKVFSSAVSWIISLLPSTPATELAFSGFLSILNIGIELFGVSTFSVVIANIAYWSIIHIAWSCIYWVYNKIPGIN